MEPDFGELHIDLHNLEDGKFEGSKYVLTSPRSLEACSRLDVKPIELLYKPLSEFQEELLPQDIPLRTIYTLYDESEEIRQKKLRLCREERCRIIEDLKRSEQREIIENRLSILPSEDAEKKLSYQNSNISPTKAAGFKSPLAAKSRNRSEDRESTKLHRELVSKKEKKQSRSRPLFKTRPSSGDLRKPQRCTTSVTKGSRVRVRSQSVPHTSVKLPVRDQKILKLMEEKLEGEVRDRVTVSSTHRMWDDQRRREETLRSIAETKRRQLLAEENRINDRRKTEEKERRLWSEEDEKEKKRMAISDAYEKADIKVMNQLRMKELQLNEKLQKEAAKSQILENNLKAKQLEDEELRQLLQAKQVAAVGSAAHRRDVMLHHLALQRFLDNRKEREHHERRKKNLEIQEKTNKEIMATSLSTRLSQAESNLGQVLEQRNLQLEEKHRAEKEKLERARRTQNKMESEMEAWRQGLLQHKKMMEERASSSVSRSLEQRTAALRQGRATREAEHRRNITKIHKEVEKWRTSLEMSLSQKERKVEDMLEEKEKTIAETRQMAQVTAGLRDDLRDKYVTDSFDKKALEAQLYSSLYSGQRSQSPSKKNLSTVKIYG